MTDAPEKKPELSNEQALTLDHLYSGRDREFISDDPLPDPGHNGSPVEQDPQKGLPPETKTGDETGVAGTPPRRDPSQVRPWVRFFARFIDLNISSCILIAVIAGVAMMNQAFMQALMRINPVVDLLATALLNTAFWILLIEPFLISRYGTTPGKALLRVHVRNPDGRILTYNEAFSRSVSVWARGYACGIIGLNLITLIIAGTQIDKAGKAPWDQSGGHIVVHETVGLLRGTVAVVLIIGFWVLQRLILL